MFDLNEAIHLCHGFKFEKKNAQIPVKFRKAIPERMYFKKNVLISNYIDFLW